MRERNFVDPVTGQNSSLPWSREDALANGYTRWMDRDGCQRCADEGRGSGMKARYLKDDNCSYCLNIDGNYFWPQWSQGDPGRPEPWSTTPERSRLLGLDWYYGSPSHPIVCPHGPHLRKTSMVTGRCVECEKDKAYFKSLLKGPRPRAEARAKGENYYVPLEACPVCSTLAKRHVVTNACSGCSKAGSIDDARRSPSQIFAEQFPDFIIDRASARGLGFTLFRTGEPCRRGHTGWRYVSTGNCVDCLRGKE